MLRQIFYPGLLAGLIAGLFIFGAQQISLIPMVMEAETFENAVDKGHQHGQPAATADSNVHIHDDGSRHVHGADEWAPSDGIERTVFSLFSNLITAIGFGLVLAGAIALSRRRFTWQQGVVWGLAGYVAVHLAPALGLPPELPGMAGEGDLFARQTWAISTTVATGVGLALLAFGRTWMWRIAGVVLVAAPHFIDIERVHAEHAVPAELVAQFVVSTLVVTALFWMLLGALSTYFSRRFTETSGA